MSLRTLALDQLNISSSSDRLELSVSTTAVIASPTSSLSSLDNSGIITALTSGNIWTSRGVGCQIEIHVSMDDEPPESALRDQIMERLASYLRHAPLWSQLSLSTTAEITSKRSTVLEPDILLRIRHLDPMPAPRSAGNTKTILLASDNIDIPQSVLCARFEKLRLHMDFKGIKSTTKKTKLSKTDSDQPDVMLLDEMDMKQHDNVHMEFIGKVVGDFPYSISNSTTTGFDDRKTIVMEQTPLELKQTDPEDDERLLSQNNEAPSLTYESSLSSLSSSIRPLKRPNSNGHDHSRSDGHSLILMQGSACKLGEAALRLLIGGYGKGMKGFRGVQIKKPSPSTSLSQVVPSLWSPGFKESVKNNAHFLPTVVQAIASSWSRNVQSPTLRQKLTQLADSLPSIYHNEEDSHGDEGSVERLEAVVQSRLWAMIQRKLHDPSAARRLRNTSENGEEQLIHDWQDFGDLLGEASKGGFLAGVTINDQVAIDLAEFMDEEFLVEEEEEEGSILDDLLAELEDDCDLLGDNEQIEREAIEQETEEMLLLDNYSQHGVGHKVQFPAIGNLDKQLADFKDLESPSESQETSKTLSGDYFLVIESDNEVLSDSEIMLL